MSRDQGTDGQAGGRQRVVILGAGFGGLSAASHLASGVRRGAPLDITLIDRNNYHVFSPLLYQAAVGLVDTRSVAYPTRAIASELGVDFLRADVLGIDRAAHCVVTSQGPRYYDWLVVALGSVPRLEMLDDPEGLVVPLKSVGDATEIHRRILSSLEEAELTDDPQRRRDLLAFTIVGGGPTGLELAGALRALIADVAGREYRRFRNHDARVIVLEGADSVLPGLPDKLTRAAMRRLQERSVDIRLGERVSFVNRRGVHSEGGTVYPSGMVVWAAGVRPNPLVDDLPGERTRDGRVHVRPTLQLDRDDRTLLIGDAAAFVSPGADRPLGALAPVAIQQGATAARNILRAMAGRPMRRFHYRDQGNLVILGRYAAVAQVRGIEFDGIAAWLLWRGVHLAWLTGLRNKLQVLVDWSLLTSTPRQTSLLEPIALGLDGEHRAENPRRLART